MARDSLRATLDELKLDEHSATDRPYLEAMLRRLGYTETEIREELGPPVEVDTPTLPQDFGADPDFGADDDVAPAREYRLVIPARESAFAFESPQTGGPDSPFEDFERVEFEENAAQEDIVEFSEVPFEPEAAPFEGEPDAMPLEEFQEVPLQEFTEFTEAPQEFTEAPVEELQADEPSAGVDDVSIDTFGGPDVDTQPKTRVRIKRVRAKSKQEAEDKVSSGNRRVIKSIPVDIVERWGGGEKQPGAKK